MAALKDYGITLDKHLVVPGDYTFDDGFRGARRLLALREPPTAIFGTLPIALGWGAGGESRRPLGIATVGGLLTSQLLTLYFTPAFYLVMERLSERLKGRRASDAKQQPAST